MVSVSRVFLFTIIIVAIVPIAFYATIFISGFFKPLRRGFFCDDQSIQLPYFDSTVPSSELFGFGLAIPVLLILCGEYIHYIKKQEFVQFYHSVFRHVICFGSGFVFQYFLVSVGKITVGRLRPNFIAVCGIDLDKVCRNNSHGYVSSFTCPNGEDTADESRVSFPSGHSAFSFYVAVFTVVSQFFRHYVSPSDLYLQRRIKFGTVFWKPLVQFLVILLAWWIAMTRIMNNQHYFSDVIVGILIGSGVAILNPVVFNSLLEGKHDADLDATFIKSDFNGSSSQEEAASEKSRLLQDRKINDTL